jgi:hypothetical protein
MSIHPLYNYDCLAHISRYLHFRTVCECETVCKFWRDAMRQPNVWMAQSHIEKIPSVIAAPDENRDRKADFKFLFPITMGAEWYGKAGFEVPDDEVPMISKADFDRLNEDDPFDKELYLAQQSSGGGKRTFDEAFRTRMNRVRKIWETFLIIVTPRYIKKYFETSLIVPLIKNGFKINENDNNPLLHCVSDMYWFDEFVNKIQTLEDLAALHTLDWDSIIEKACDKEFFATLKTFFYKDRKFDSYTDFLKDLFISFKDSNNKLLLELMVRKFMDKSQIDILEKLETEDIHLHIPISMPNLDVLFRHVRKGPFLSERIDFNLKKQLAQFSHKSDSCGLILMRKEVPEQTLNQSANAQYVLIKNYGFDPSGVLFRTWYNWVECMRTDQCPDDLQHPAVRGYSKGANAFVMMGIYRKTRAHDLAPGLQFTTLLGANPHARLGVIPVISHKGADTSSQASANPTSQQ